jgi:hypothetical protein
MEKPHSPGMLLPAATATAATSVTTAGRARSRGQHNPGQPKLYSRPNPASENDHGFTSSRKGYRPGEQMPGAPQALDLRTHNTLLVRGSLCRMDDSSETGEVSGLTTTARTYPSCHSPSQRPAIPLLSGCAFHQERPTPRTPGELRMLLLQYIQSLVMNSLVITSPFFYYKLIFAAVSTVFYNTEDRFPPFRSKKIQLEIYLTTSFRPGCRRRSPGCRRCRCPARRSP